MATCPSCGNRGWFLSTFECSTCGRKGCERCLKDFGQAPHPGGGWETRRTCSMDCFDRWASGWVHHGYAATFVGPSWSFMDVFIAPEYAGRVNQMAADLAKQRALSHASNLIDAERFEDAAKIYESLGMWKEAGEIRRTGRRQVVTQVSVDINELIDQMRSGGLTAVYACPACGSHLTVSGDSMPSSLRSCAYCGAAIQAADLADVLTKAIGYR